MIALYYTINLLDLAITLYATRNGLAAEGNAIMRYLLRSPWVFAAVKATVPLLICVWLKRAPRWFTATLCILQGGIVLWDIFILKGGIS